MKYTFTKKERLSSKKLIDQLFTEGKTFFSYPFKVFYLFQEAEKEFPVQVLITVSKKNFKKAVDRNKLKRLVREGYRKNKSNLFDQLSKDNKSLLFGLIYVGESILSYQEMERKLILILQRLIEQDEEAIE